LTDLSREGQSPHQSDNTHYGNDLEEKTHPREEAKLTRGQYAEDAEGILITGQMSLYDVEMQTGVSAREIAGRLGIPGSVRLDERLGRLKRTYSFTVQDVREIVSALMNES
jgi:hypothetical protein